MNVNVFVYVSGPITPKDGFLAEENVLVGLKAHISLINHGIPNFCPQLSGAFPTAWTAVPWEKWLEYDMAVITRCTHMLMLPRWEASAGALKEKEFALKQGIPVFYSIHELIKSLEK